MSMPNILVAGIGNVFLGDDGFGVEVVRKLSERPLPDEVRVVDIGIRSFDLAYALLDGPDLTILVDATQRGNPPGTLYTIEVNTKDLGSRQTPTVEGHRLDPMQVLKMAKGMAGELGRILLVGCEPETFGPEDEGQMGLSPPVAAAVGRAVELIEALIAKTRSDRAPANSFTARTKL